MEILLLNIASLSLERHVAGLAVDKHVSGYNTHGCSIGQTVQECSLSSARHAHECRQGARLDPAIDVIEDPSVLLLNLDVVADIAPLEHRGLLLKNATFLGMSTTAAFRCDDRTDVGHGSFRIALFLLSELGSDRLVTFAIDQNSSLGFLLRYDLGSNHVNTEEDYYKRDENA